MTLGLFLQPRGTQLSNSLPKSAIERPAADSIGIRATLIKSRTSLRAGWPIRVMGSDGANAAKLIHGLAKRSSEGLSAKEEKVRERIRSRIFQLLGRPIPEYEPNYMKTLENRLGNSEVNLSADSSPGTLIALRPIVKSDELLPFLSLAASADLSRFRLVLLLFKIESGRTAGSKGALRSLRFRFESPESPEKPGRHNFWHMQLSANIASSSEVLDDTTPTWLPKSTPAIPLNADNAPTCVINLAMALYGGLVAKDLAKESLSDDDLSNAYKSIRFFEHARGHRMSEGFVATRIFWSWRPS